MQSFRITEWSTIKFGGKGCAKSASQRGEKKFRWDGISKQARKSMKTKERKNFENERKQSEQAEEKCDPKEEGGGGRGAENEAQRESLPPSPLQKTNFEAESFLVEGKRRGEEEEKEGRVENRARFQRRGKEESLKVGCDRTTYKAWNGTESRVGVVRGAIRSRYTRRHLRNGIPVPYKTGSNKEEWSATANRRILDTLRSPREISSSNCIASSLEKGIAQPSIRRLVCDDEKNQNRTIIF